jgi:hypothetical protein
MQIKVRHSFNGKIFWALMLVPSFLITLQLVLLGIQNFNYQNYFILFPMLLLLFLISYLVLHLFWMRDPISIDGEHLTFAENFSFQKKTFLITQILNVSIEAGFVGARVRLMDEDGILYTIGCLDTQDVSVLRELSSLNIL